MKEEFNEENLNKLLSGDESFNAKPYEEKEKSDYNSIPQKALEIEANSTVEEKRKEDIDNNCKSAHINFDTKIEKDKGWQKCYCDEEDNEMQIIKENKMREEFEKLEREVIRRIRKEENDASIQKMKFFNIAKEKGYIRVPIVFFEAFIEALKDKELTCREIVVFFELFLVTYRFPQPEKCYFTGGDKKLANILGMSYSTIRVVMHSLREKSMLRKSGRFIFVRPVAFIEKGLQKKKKNLDKVNFKQIEKVNRAKSKL